MLVLMACATRAPAPTAAALLEAAEQAHHCAGEESTDEKRAEFLSDCIETSMAEARRMLPQVVGDLPPPTAAVVRLYVQELDAGEQLALCTQVPPDDFLPGLLDDEARAVCQIR